MFVSCDTFAEVYLKARVPTAEGCHVRQILTLLLYHWACNNTWGRGIWQPEWTDTHSTHMHLFMPMCITFYYITFSVACLLLTVVLFDDLLLSALMAGWGTLSDRFLGFYMAVLLFFYVKYMITKSCQLNDFHWLCGFTQASTIVPWLCIINYKWS